MQGSDVGGGVDMCRTVTHGERGCMQGSDAGLSVWGSTVDAVCDGGSVRLRGK